MGIGTLEPRVENIEPVALAEAERGRDRRLEIEEDDADRSFGTTLGVRRAIGGAILDNIRSLCGEIGEESHLKILE